MRCKSPSNFTVILIHSSYLISLISQFKLVVFAALTRLVGFFLFVLLRRTVRFRIPFESLSFAHVYSIKSYNYKFGSNFVSLNTVVAYGFTKIVAYITHVSMKIKPFRINLA